jgi:hypothetical protein
LRSCRFRLNGRRRCRTWSDWGRSWHSTCGGSAGS